MRSIGRLISAAAFIIPGMLIAAPAGAQGAKTTWDGIYTTAQAAQGETQYMSNCIACHGTDLAGVEDSPGLANDEFRKHWDGQPIYSLFSFIGTQMPADRPGTLGQDVYANITAFLLSRNGFPAGPTALPADGKTLNTLMFKVKK